MKRKYVKVVLSVPPYDICSSIVVANLQLLLIHDKYKQSQGICEYRNRRQIGKLISDAQAMVRDQFSDTECISRWLIDLAFVASTLWD